MKMVIFALGALAGGAILYNRVKRSVRTAKKQKDDALVDAMSEQSFPASDSPAY